MADKKFIRDLNSLIRIDQRKRLKLPASRPNILGGIGIASASTFVEPIVEELMYIRHFGGGVATNSVWIYGPNGEAPVLHAVAGDRGGLGINNGDTYSGNLFGPDIYKNGTLFVSTGLPYAILAANSTHVIVQDDLYNAHRYTLDGTFVDTFLLPHDFAGGQNHCANNHLIGYRNSVASGDAMALCDFSGVQVASEIYEDFGNSHAYAASKYVTAFVDGQAVSPFDHLIKLFNNAGTKIATYNIGKLFLQTEMNGSLSAIGITSNRIFFFGCSSGVPNCVIYEHTLTIDGSGLATAGVLGSHLYTVATPQNNNSIYQVYQQAVVESLSMA